MFATRMTFSPNRLAHVMGIANAGILAVAVVGEIGGRRIVSTGQISTPPIPPLPIVLRGGRDREKSRWVGAGRLGITFATRLALSPNRLAHVLVIANPGVLAVAVAGEIGGRKNVSTWQISTPPIPPLPIVLGI